MQVLFLRAFVKISPNVEKEKLSRETVECRSPIVDRFFEWGEKGGLILVRSSWWRSCTTYDWRRSSWMVVRHYNILVHETTTTSSSTARVVDKIRPAPMLPMPLIARISLVQFYVYVVFRELPVETYGNVSSAPRILWRSMDNLWTVEKWAFSIVFFTKLTNPEIELKQNGQ